MMASTGAGAAGSGGAAAASSSKPVVHDQESRADRRQQRELQEARMQGSVAPAIDANTGQMINPHNPEFITKRPWYLGTGGQDELSSSAAAAAESLQHQADQRSDRERRELSLTAAEELLEKQRRKLKQQAAAGRFEKGQWVEALKKNKMPYRICQIIKIHGSSGDNKHQEFDLQFEDGSIERKVRIGQRNSTGTTLNKPPRIRMTVTGNRSTTSTSTTSVSMDNNDTYKETFASKRDQYHGYDRDKHNAILNKKYEQKLEIRRQLREAQQQRRKEGEQQRAAGKTGGASDSDSDDSDVEGGGGNNNSGDESDDEFVQRDEDDRVLTTRLARQGGVGGAQMKVTARNLRIREDTAKYLRNLDPNSAYYDPKSRSMRDNPHPETAAAAGETDFAGDNFARISGDAVALAQQQLFAWDATEQGVTEVHPQANPSQAELLKRQFQTKAQDLKLQAKRAVLDKYGGEEYLDGGDGLASAVVGKNGNDAKPAAAAALVVAADRKLRFGVSTETEHYSRDGRLLKHGETQKRKALESKYEENVFINGHTTVWGSFFHKGAFTWGYADDHSLMKQSYCTGENGRMANDEANEMTYGTGQAGSAALAQARGMLKPKPSMGNAGGSVAPTSALANRSKLYGEADPSAVLDDRKVKEALAKQEKEQDDRNKRKYHSMNADVDMTEEMMEAYRIRKDKKSDPMANLGSDELLDYKK